MSKTQRNVLFIIPPEFSKQETIGKNLAHYKEIPYGPLSIAAYLKENCTKEIHIKILDLNLSAASDFKEVVQNTIESLKPLIVGISGLFNTMFNDVNRISEWVKSEHKETLLVVGGNIATNCFEQLFAHNPHLDGACCFEGELPMFDLVESDDMLQLLDSHPSWLTRNKLAQNFKPSPSFVQDLDDIPPLDFSLIELEKYDSRCRNNNPVNVDKDDDIRLPFITTRGCPYNCIFCSASSLSGKQVRFMSAERVISDINRAKKLYGMTKVVINDDQALIDKKRIKNILSAIAEMKLVLEFPSGLNAQFIDNDLAHHFKCAGLDVANLAIESGSEHVLKQIIDKPLRLDKIKPAVDALRKHGLFVHAFFIFGFPDEKEADRQATTDLIKEIGLDWSNIYVAAPLRGSRLFEICVEKGYISGDGDLLGANIYESSIKTPDINPDFITKYSYIVNLDVNFVNNFRMSIGDYKTAAGYFKNVAKNHPDHAFAHFFLAEAYEKGNFSQELIQTHRKQFYNIVNNNDDWAEYAQQFCLNKKQTINFFD